MAKGDYHVEDRGGRWVVEQEGYSNSSREHVETVASADQAWRIAVFYAQSARVDVFLHGHRKIEKEQRFRDGRR